MTRTRDRQVRDLGPMTSGRATPARMAPFSSLLQTAFSVDQIFDVAPATHVRSLWLSRNRLIEVTDGRVTWADYRNSEGIEITTKRVTEGDFGPFSSPADQTTSMRPQIRKIDSDRAAYIHQLNGVIQLVVFDQRGFVWSSHDTGLAVPPECWVANPRLAVSPDQVLWVFPNATNGVAGSALCYRYSVDPDGVFTELGSLNLETGLNPVNTPFTGGIETTTGTVVLAATGVPGGDDDRVLVCGRSGSGTTLQYFWRCLSPSGNGPALEPLGYSQNPTNAEEEEETADTYQQGAMGEVLTKGGFVIGMISRRARIFPPTTGRIPQGGRTLPGVRIFFAMVNADKTVSMSLDDVRGVSTNNTANSVNWLYDDIQVADDATRDRWTFSGFGGVGGQQGRALALDLAGGESLGDARLIIGENPTLERSFDWTATTSSRPFLQLLPLPAPPRNPVPQPPTRAFVAVLLSDDGEHRRARLYHAQPMRSRTLKVSPLRLVSLYDDVPPAVR